jgi:hypothetical protein
MTSHAYLLDGFFKSSSSGLGFNSGDLRKQGTFNDLKKCFKNETVRGGTENPEPATNPTCPPQIVYPILTPSLP